MPRLPCVPGRPTAINRAGHQSQPSVIKAASATQMLRPSAHASHAKCRWMSPSATPAMQSAAAPRATNGDQARHRSQPRSATPAMQSAAAPRATNGDQARHRSQPSVISAACQAKCRCVCVYTVITNGFSSFHCSCTILKSRGQRYPCHFLCQRSWVTCGKDIDQGRLIYVPAIVSTVDFLLLFMSCALFLRSRIWVR